MLLSLLICEYIEEYVAKHLCAWKNRRRRGLRSFYHGNIYSSNRKPMLQSFRQVVTHLSSCMLILCWLFFISSPLLFTQDFRERRSSPNVGTIQHYSSRTRSYSAAAWVGGGASGDGPGEMMLVPEGTVPFPASAPPSERPECYAQLTNYPAISPSASDEPPSYEACVLSRVRLNNPNENTRDSNADTNAASTPPRKSSVKKSSSTEKEK